MCVAGIANHVVEDFLKEMRDTKKIIHSHLSSMNGELSWEQAKDKEKHHSMHVLVVNNLCESSFGVPTKEINTHNNVGLTHAGDIAMAKKNGHFETVF